MSTSAIVTNNLTRRFGALVAVDNLTLRIEKGELFGLVGPDGAGKTTTLRLLASLLDPSSGSAAMDGYDTVSQDELVKGRIGYMSQRFGLYPDLTVEENLSFYADIYCVPKGEKKNKIEELLAFSKLSPFRARLAEKLSGGMKQKLALSCALIHKPSILLLDEPTSGVDPLSRRDFWSILFRLGHDGVTILIATAYLDEAEHCQRLAFINQGKLIALGSPEQLKAPLQKNILKLHCKSPRQVAAFLEEMLGEDTVNLYGSALHIFTPSPENTILRIQRKMEEKGIAIDLLESGSPSLEDVFIASLSPESLRQSNV